MICQRCGQEFIPTHRAKHLQKYCSRKCNNAVYYRRHKAEHDAYSKEWAHRNPERRQAIYLRHQRRKAKEIYQKNKWREPDRRKRVESRAKLLKLRPPKCVGDGQHRGRIECHHLDGNPQNTDITNLAWLCKKHHEDLHHSEGRRSATPASSHHPEPSIHRTES